MRRPGDARVRQGRERLEAGDAAGALALFDAVIAEDAEHPGAWWGRADALAALDRGVEAATARVRALMMEKQARGR